MAQNDPSSTGGLFIGRRPGTAPLRYREQPAEATGARRRADSIIAGAILALEVLLLATIWGPQPAGWLWVGSQVDWLTDNVVLGILTAFVGMVATIFATISIAMRLDRIWKLVRRACGHEQKEGALERIFVLSVVVGGIAFGFWFLIIQGPGPSFSPNANTPAHTAGGNH
jgi:hypothetical protein